MVPNAQALHARWVIPVEPAGQVLEHHTVVIENATIRAVLPTSEWRSPGPGMEELTLPEHALIPGLVNTHTHAAMSLFRGMADDRPLMDWLTNHIWPAEARAVNREFVRDGTRLAAAEMLLGGTTCMNDMYFFGDEAAAAAIEAGLRAVIGMIVIGFPSAWAADVDEYFRKGQAVHDQYRDHPLITTAFAPHAPYTVDDAALTRIATLAEELDCPVHMHVQETADEVEQAIAANGLRPLRRLQGLGLVTPRLLAVHATCLDPEEMDLLATRGVTVVHCPESNLKLASGFCPVAELLARGVNVALGTDGAASNNDLDMLGELRTASLLAKGVAGDPCALPAAQALRMATWNGAQALGLERSIGSIGVGKQADLVAIDLGDLRARPVYDPVSQIVYSAHRDQVTQVWVAGRHVVRNRQLATLDVLGLKASAEEWGQRLL
ncbi:MAG: TRZ/ATZ family hydrolase [Gammaproteobacteria bacterium]|nr:TRZ/ATZ family hydrolase [Gammaproteobacteria bacterium]